MTSSSIRSIFMSKIKDFIYLLVIFIALSGVYIVFEPKETSAADANNIFNVTQNVTSEISLSCDSSIVLTPSFPSKPGGLTPTSGPAKDDFDCKVITNNSAGYNLKVKNKDLGGSNIALVHNADSNYKFTNYTPTPTYNWTEPSAGQALFAFTMGATSGSDAATDINQDFKNNGSACNTGSNVNDSSDMDNAKCWRGLDDTNEINVVASDDDTTIDGEIFRFRFQARADAIQLKAGDYTTELTVTATY